MRIPHLLWPPIFLAHVWHIQNCADVEEILHAECDLFFSSFTSSLNCMRCQQGSSLCVSEILNTGLWCFFPLSEEIFRKSAVPLACQKPPVYHGICTAVSYSSLAMADILSCIFGYQVNINCKGTNKPVPYACLILFHLIPVSLTDLVYCYVSPEKTQQDCLPSVVWLTREQMEGVSPIGQSPLQTQISIPAQPITTTVPVRDFVGSRSLSFNPQFCHGVPVVRGSAHEL